MTIAAGTLCTDGILMCADREEADYVGKYQVRKIRTFGDDPLVISGAGAGSYLDMAADLVYEKFHAGWPINPRDAREKAGEVVYQIHDRHIFNWFQTGDANRPSIGLVIATRCGDGELALIGSIDSATFSAHNWSVSVGIGKHLWEYWARLFELEGLPASVAAYISLFIIREISTNVPGCGGNADSVILLRDPNGNPTKTHYGDHRKILAAFPQSAADLLIRCIDPLTSDQSFDKSVEQFVATLRELRTEAKTTASFSVDIQKQIEAPENE